MIEDARKINPGTILEADLCIVGGGAAAITLALQYMKSGHTAIIIPGGGPNQSSACIDLYRGKVSPASSHEPLEENRLRMWGGTTTVWGGRCVPFDPIDFKERSWIPGSGWPIELAGLKDYIEQANQLSEAGKADFDARSAFPETQTELLKGFDDDELVTWPLERWSIPTDYSKRYRDDFESAHNVRVLLYAHAIHLQMNTEGTVLEHVRAACSPGKDFQVHAKNTVIACGALENTRLLLASKDILPAGIGNQNDLVGRFYQSHRFGVCGYAELKDPNKDFIYDFEKDAEGVYCRRRFWLTAETQEKYQINNVVGFFSRGAADASEHRNAMVSLVMLIKTVLGGARMGPKRLFQILKDQRSELAAHAWIVLKDGPSIFGQLASVAYLRFFQKRRLPMILPPKKSNHFPLFFQTEHAPQRESRVLLDESSVDNFGMPRLETKIQFSEVDYKTIRIFVTLFKKRLEESGLGTFHLSKADQALLKEPGRKAFNSNAHNIGTTRMAASADNGVVDTDCKVYGVSNLYVAGSSIFPTSSHANPTLMIIALSLRLADHLKDKSDMSHSIPSQ
ncbi:GMC oxidoreductase [Coraliomargarita sp. SDUM461004]|uniref:GMC oxidoreductase n=1 Tax=Thalassobacterium sedimentorum TaxID=3041258 RepID=A0ABU1AMC0_9BACT|nr:GMC oxidoreductase [Coraliomargarita sp. SDUM461004]MDQ8195931.1 GMC oxidoreductase [Coraliomargarita sp. SDUM461004]